MAIYRPINTRALADISMETRLSNQIVFYGNTGNTLSVPKGSVFIEFLQVEGAGSIDIEDGDGNTVVSGLTDFSNDHSPLRCDKGITLTGSLKIAKGFVLDGIFIS
jgi:hypothetical protein